MRAFFFAALVGLLMSSPSFSDGLVHQLPTDGSSAYFSMELTTHQDGKSSSLKGSLTISSVGRAVVNGQPCRWIEVKTITDDGGASAELQLRKLLIPEKYLTAGQSPLEHVAKAWALKASVRRTEKGIDFKAVAKGEPRQVKDPTQSLTLLTLVLAGPLRKAKALREASVASGLGSLQCEGIAGEIPFGGVAASVESRLHAKAPFGVVSWEVRVRVKADPKQERARITLKLVEIVRNAKSEIPDAQ
jgi:hypothetical protein